MIFTKINCWFISSLALFFFGLAKSNFCKANGRRYSLMLDTKVIYGAEFKCRICAAKFNNPEQLRVHRMTAHKGHYLTLTLKK